MKFISVLIKEGRKEDLKKKYSSKFSEEDLNFVLNISDLQDFNHKYTDFILKNVSSNNLHQFIEDLIKIIKDFDKYNSQLEKKDINQYQGFAELAHAISPIKAKEKEKELEKKVEKIYEDDKFVVIKPETIEASCKYGSNTKWCTTVKGSDHFKRYTSGGQGLYYIINKANSTNENYSKVAVHFDNNGYAKYWDSKDAPMTDREIKIFEYAFPEIINAIDENYKKLSSSSMDKFLNEVFNTSGVTVRTLPKYLNRETSLTVSVEGFETINDLGPGHAQGACTISLSKEIIDKYYIFITFIAKNKQTFEASIGFMGTDDFIDTDNFVDLGLENWGIDSKYLTQGIAEKTAEAVRDNITSKILFFIKDNSELQKKVVGSAKVFTSTYGYTFSKNKGWVKKLVDYLDAGKIGTKLDFLTELGYLVKTTKDGQTMFRKNKGQHLYTPRELRGQHASFFAAAKNAGILGYRKIGRDFFLTKGPNFDAFKSGELKAL